MSLSYLQVFEIVGISVRMCPRVTQAAAMTNAPDVKPNANGARLNRCPSTVCPVANAEHTSPHTGAQTFPAACANNAAWRLRNADAVCAAAGGGGRRREGLDNGALGLRVER